MKKFFSRKLFITILSQASLIIGALKGIIDPKIATVAVTAINSCYVIAQALVDNPEITTLVTKGIAQKDIDNIVNTLITTKTESSKK